jgi:hypothetical protein
VESDIRPFRGLLLGLFFVTTGTSIDLQVRLYFLALCIHWQSSTSHPFCLQFQYVALKQPRWIAAIGR